MKSSFSSAVFAIALLPMVASAERTDAQKELNIETESGVVDQVKGISILTGNVVITRGTMRVKSDKAEVKIAPDGFRQLVLTAAPGKVATFRQKRDGGPDLWEEGEAERIEYDERTDVIKLFSNVIVRELQANKITNEITGQFLSYDARTEIVNVRNDSSGTDKPRVGRVTMIIPPRRN
jgi:lipopolysaccharide export system protein LptA